MVHTREPTSRSLSSLAVGGLSLGLILLAAILALFSREQARAPKTSPLALEQTSSAPAEAVVEAEPERQPKAEVAAPQAAPERTGRQTINAAKRRLVARTGQPKALRRPRESVPKDSIEVRLEPPLPTRALSPGAVRRLLSANERDVAACYEGHARKRDKVDIRLVVDPAGTVREAEVVSVPRESAEIAECLSVKARAWKFPAFGGDVSQEIVVPLLVVAPPRPGV